MFLSRKNQYFENDYTTKCNLQIQCDPYQVTNGIFHSTRTKLWTELRDIVQETGIKTIPKKKKCKKAKWLSEKALQRAVKKRSKKQRIKRKIYPFECRVTKKTQEKQESLPQ